jgi:hypothetical protein
MMCRLRRQGRCDRGKKYCRVEVLRKAGADAVGTRLESNYGQVCAIILTAETSSVRALLDDDDDDDDGAPAAGRLASGLVAPGFAPEVDPVAPDDDAAAGLPVTCTRCPT